MQTAEQINATVIEYIINKGDEPTLEHRMYLLKAMRRRAKAIKKLSIRRLIYVHRLNQVIDAIALSPEYNRHIFFPEKDES